jgi:hypothetical protein
VRLLLLHHIPDFRFLHLSNSFEEENIFSSKGFRKCKHFPRTLGQGRGEEACCGVALLLTPGVSSQFTGSSGWYYLWFFSTGLDVASGLAPWVVRLLKPE